MDPQTQQMIAALRGNGLGTYEGNVPTAANPMVQPIANPEQWTPVLSYMKKLMVQDPKDEFLPSLQHQLQSAVYGQIPLPRARPPGAPQ